MTKSIALCKQNLQHKKLIELKLEMNCRLSTSLQQVKKLFQDNTFITLHKMFSMRGSEPSSPALGHRKQAAAA
jgi:hypothetical protein